MKTHVIIAIVFFVEPGNEEIERMLREKVFGKYHSGRSTAPAAEGNKKQVKKKTGKTADR